MNKHLLCNMRLMSHECVKYMYVFNIANAHALSNNINVATEIVLVL